MRWTCHRFDIWRLFLKVWISNSSNSQHLDTFPLAAFACWSTKTTLTTITQYGTSASGFIPRSPQTISVKDPGSAIQQSDSRSIVHGVDIRRGEWGGRLSSPFSRDTVEPLTRLNFFGALAQWGIQTKRLGGGSQIRGAKKSSLVQIYQLLCDNRWVSHKSSYLF